MLKNENIKAKEYLEKEPVQSWARCYFDTTSKCEYSNNNFSESFNKWLLPVRHLTIVKLVDKYTDMLSKQFYDRKLCSMDLLHGEVLVPRVDQLIKKLDKKYFKWCSPWFTIEAYKAAYEGYIVPLSDVDEWGNYSDMHASSYLVDFVVNKYKRNEAVGQQTEGASTSRGMGRGGGGSSKRGRGAASSKRGRGDGTNMGGGDNCTRTAGRGGVRMRGGIPW
ncbi:hypothetical protein FRX31_023836, partial [Thalictrum thalictroides]